MEMSSRCRYWILTAVWLMVSAASLGGFEIDNELSLTDNEYVDVEDEFQDIFVERRSLNPMQRNSLEGMCRWTMCPPSSVCRLRRNGRARCVCRPCRPDELRTGPVCGSDSRTYASACKLHRANCRASEQSSVGYTGPCQTSCAGVTCSVGKSCVVDQLGLPHCLSNDCPFNSADRSPVCGADGHTYTGLCRLHEATCRVGRSVRLAYSGHCRGDLNCDKLDCQGGLQCVMNLATSTPMCVDCARPCYPTTVPGYGTSYQLCGTDGRTYNNWCSMVRATCSRRVFVETRHFGPCQGDNEELQLE